MAVISQLERYRYISDLGAGGMSTVVLAEDQVLARPVALKQVHGTGDVRSASRLRREALIGASVSHPNLVSIFDVFSSGDRHVIVMEYVDGETLGEAITRDPRPPVRRVLEILDGVAAALDAIHERRIVHRDVKPGNILLGSAGDIKLADLGIAAAPDRTQITTDGAIIGTFSYMAPEQLEGTAMPPVDVYALAAVAFEVLAGRKARTETNPLALAHAIATQPPPDLRDAWPHAPREAAAVLTRGMAREPSERPSSASELTQRLRAALEPQASALARVVAGPRAVPRPRATLAPRISLAPRATPPRPPRLPRPDASPRPAGRRPAPVASALLIALAAVVAALALGSGGRSPDRRLAGSHARGRPATRAAKVTHLAAPASTPTGAPAGSPVSATESFYRLAASHRYASAWALADPALRSQLGGYRSFQSGQTGDRSIAFDSARTVSRSPGSTTVAVRTTSVRSDGTQHCAGTVDLVPAGSGRWVLRQIHINCS